MDSRINFADKIQWHRYINYEIHYAARTLIKTLDPIQTADLARVATLALPFPLLNLLGATHDGWLPEKVKKALESFPKHILFLINPYYLSDDGWDGFQRLWQNMPEPEEMNWDAATCLPSPDSSNCLPTYKDGELRMFSIIEKTIQQIRLSNTIYPQVSYSTVDKVLKSVDNSTESVDREVDKNGSYPQHETYMVQCGQITHKPVEKTEFYPQPSCG